MNRPTFPPNRVIREPMPSGWWIPATVVFAVLSVWLVIAIEHPEPLPAAPLSIAPGASVSELRSYAVGSPPVVLVRYTERDRTLRITEHAPRDLLVCLRGDCRLVEEWLGK